MRDEVTSYCLLQNTHALTLLSVALGLSWVLFFAVIHARTGCTCCRGLARVPCHRLVVANYNMVSQELRLSVLPCVLLHGILHTLRATTRKVTKERPTCATTEICCS